MSDCPFCERIDARDYEQEYASEAVVRFEPLNPVTPGHMLFVPGEHLTHPSSEGVRVAMGYAEYYAGRRGEDFNLITSSGPAATQTVDHIHVHYVPRRPGDGLHLPWTPQPELAKVAAQALREAAGQPIEVSRAAVVTERAECHKAQCACGHPTEDALVALIVERVRVSIRDYADRMARGER